MSYETYECSMDPNTPMDMQPPPSVGAPSSLTTQLTPDSLPYQSNPDPMNVNQQWSAYPPTDSGFISVGEPFSYDETQADPNTMDTCWSTNSNANSQSILYNQSKSYANSGAQMSSMSYDQATDTYMDDGTCSIANQMTPNDPILQWNQSELDQLNQTSYSCQSSVPMTYQDNSLMPSTGVLSSGSITPGGQLTPLGPQQLPSTSALRNSPQLTELEMSYQQNDVDWANKASDAIPELVKLLRDEDPVVVNQAALTVLVFSQRDACLHLLINSPDLIRALIGTMFVPNPDVAVIKYVASILNNLSQKRQGLSALMQNGGIQAIIKLLDASTESILFYSITTMHNLLLHVDGAKMAVLSDERALPQLIKLLSSNNHKFLAIVTDCLQILAYGNQECKLRILKLNGTDGLVRIMNKYDYEKLLWTTSRVLKVLSVCSENKPAIVACGGLQALARHLNKNGSKGTRLVLNCLWTMRNLSDAAVKRDDLRPLLETLVSLLSAEDPNIVTCVTGILSNLTCNNQNKVIVFQLGGIEELLELIRKYGKSSQRHDDLIEPAVCALRHLTSRHSSSEEAQIAVRMNNGIPVIVSLLHTANGWPLIKASIGLLRNVAICAGNHSQLRQYDIITKVVHWMNLAYNKMTFPPQPVYENGVCMDDIIEGTIGSLQSLAKDPINRQRIRQMNLIPKFVGLVYNPWSIKIKRVACGVLSELASDNEGATIIRTSGIINILNEIIQAPQFQRSHLNEPPSQIVVYATELLDKLIKKPVIADRALPASPFDSCFPNYPEQSSEMFDASGFENPPTFDESF